MVGTPCGPGSTLNLTLDEVTASLILYTDVDRILVPFIMSTILISGLMTNVAFLFVVFRVRHMRTATNHYLVQIAIADMIYLVFGAGAKVLRFFTSPVAFDLTSIGEPGCILVPLFSSVAYFALLFFMALVTREKFLAICKPVRYREIHGRRRTVRMTLAAWGVALCFASTMIPASSVFVSYCILWPVSWTTTHLPSHAARCRPVSPWLVSYTDFVQTSPYFIVMVLTTVMNACILKSVRVQILDRDQHQGPITLRKMQTKRRVTHMLVVNGIVFFCFLAPFEICSISAWILSYNPQPLLHSETFRLTSQIARILAYLQAAVNPILYYVIHPRYRSAFVESFSMRDRAGVQTRATTMSHR